MERAWQTDVSSDGRLYHASMRSLAAQATRVASQCVIALCVAPRRCQDPQDRAWDRRAGTEEGPCVLIAAAKEAAKAAMPKQPKAKSAKRRAAKLDKALSVERSKAEKLLAKAKARTMSHNEKTATAASAGDVQAKMDKAEREEVQAQASKSMSPTFDSERQMEKEMIARAAEATSQVEEMEMGEGVHELQ